MQEAKFSKFWDSWVKDWYECTMVSINGEQKPVDTLCSIKEDYTSVVFDMYNHIKETTKRFYFKDTGTPKNPCHLSRYKRAAVLTYAIIKTEPLIYKESKPHPWIDPNYLKQRLAFYVALGSIIQDYPKDKVDELSEGKKIFDFSKLGKVDYREGEDDFLLSVYKDLLYAELYDDFNVLTMANVYGLLTERASILGSIQPLDPSKEKMKQE